MTYVYVVRDAYRVAETVAITRDCRVYRVGGELPPRSSFETVTVIDEGGLYARVVRLYADVAAVVRVDCAVGEGCEYKLLEGGGRLEVRNGGLYYVGNCGEVKVVDWSPRWP